MKSWAPLNVIRTASLALVVALFANASANAADMGESGDTINLAINEWTGQHISTHVAGQLLEKLGYTVDYVNAGNYPQFQALADGDIHATLEGWTNNLGDIYPVKKESGEIVDIGDLGLNAGEGWLYPKFMEEMCPGLPALDAMDACAEQLASAETFPQGRFLSYPADWGNRSEGRIAAIGLNYKAVPAGSEGALVAELKAADAASKPLFMMFWRPHWVLAEVDVGWVELPAFEAACEADPAWGSNQEAINDCGFEAPRTVKVAWSGFQEKWPAAWELLSMYQMNNADQEAMMLRIDNLGEDLVAVTKEWVDSNEANWKPWVDAAMAN
ncbi:MAG: ABC transporter substrate-binding protein [Rhodobacteraceae bacterium]|nr:ABC transporter substrate-binding protein [Paracoccaceae bacterium]